MLNSKIYNTSYRKKLFRAFVLLFIVFSVITILILFNREKNKNIEIVQSKLSVYNEVVSNFIRSGNIVEKETFSELDSLINSLFDSELRITLIDSSGKVIYDTFVKDYYEMEDHSNRNEIRKALVSGSGTDIRISESTEIEYFYYAFKQKDYFIRTALPLNAHLKDTLTVDHIFIIFLLLIFLILTFFLLYISDHYGDSVHLLRKFSIAMGSGEDISDDIEFRNNELGEISRQIKKVYDNSRVVQRNQKVMRQQISANISHELKTPVTAISGFLQTILANKDMHEDKKLDFIKRSNDQINRLNTLINDISILNKVDEVKELYVKEKVDISSLIREVISDFQPSLENNGMSVKLNLKEKISIQGNISLLEAVFRNFFDNSIKYAGEDSEIKVSLYDEDDEFYYFKYSDNGKGIPEQHLSRIFERFYRIDKGRSRAMGGTGLGLSIVKNAVEFHHGEIEAKILHPGIEFSFSLRKE